MLSCCASASHIVVILQIKLGIYSSLFEEGGGEPWFVMIIERNSKVPIAIWFVDKSQVATYHDGKQGPRHMYVHIYTYWLHFLFIMLYIFPWFYVFMLNEWVSNDISMTCESFLALSWNDLIFINVEYLI